MNESKDYQTIYKEEIDKFFQEEHVHYPYDKVKGRVWIAGKHRQYQALTIEPIEGGQMEIAVRFPMDCEHQAYADDKYSGYISTEHGFMVGRNTDGH